MLFVNVLEIVVICILGFLFLFIVDFLGVMFGLNVKIIYNFLINFWGVKVDD